MNVWLVRGEDESLVRERVSTLLAELAPDPFSLEDFSGEAYDVGAVVDACNTPPFLADRRVVVARDLHQFKTEELTPLIGWLAEPLPTTALILSTGKGLAAKLLNAVKKAGTVLDTDPGRNFKSWLVDQLHDGPVRIDNKAVEPLAQHLGDDGGRVPGLLRNLAAAYGEGARVTWEQIEPFLGEQGGGVPWDLTDAIDTGDVTTALEQLHRQLDGGGKHPLVVMAVLHGHFGTMLRLDGADVRGEEDAAALLGIHPFRAKKALAQARRLGPERIARAVLLLAEADLDLRGARDWPGPLVMEVLVARLATLAPPARARAGARSR